ncbi:MAG: HlyD family type I secretion periplasmic adaptor subunit [Acetobacteraceae bacterium]|nr:HlyD family type I secretion periplasmic adaptor subunit [Acetobacteraceae bacterium]
MTQSIEPAVAGSALTRRGSKPLKLPGPARLPLILEFQPDAVEIEARTPPRIARVTLYMVIALIVAAVSWASLASVDEIVTAPGKLITTHPNLVVQPLETSVIRDIRVAVGDLVHKGDVLATLDPTFSQSDVSELRERISALDAEINRLEAELNNRDFAASAGATPNDLLQARLFAERKFYYDASLRKLDEQIARTEANLETTQSEERYAARRLATLHEVESMREALYGNQVGSRLNLLQARDARLEVESSLAHLQGSRIELVHELAKLQSEREAFIKEFRRAALEQLVQDRGKRDSAADELQKADLRRHMVAITAPADAVVLDVAHRSIGSVVREAETLFVLVPRDEKLEAEVNVAGKDVGEVAVGEKARIKFDAFPFQKHGTATGVVRLISEDAFSSENKSSENKDEQPGHGPLYYRVRVDLTDTKLRAVPQHFHLIPGMALSAEMKVGQRSVISYFLYPLLRGLDESIREP